MAFIDYTIAADINGDGVDPSNFVMFSYTMDASNKVHDIETFF